MLNTNFDLSQFLLFNPTTDRATLTNASGVPILIHIGTLLGRIAATNLIVAQVSTATDGSQVPIGASCAEYTIADGTSQEIVFVRAGEVNSGLIKYGGTDTAATSITDNGGTHLGTIGDILAGKGLFLKGATNLNYFDAQ